MVKNFIIAVLLLSGAAQTGLSLAADPHPQPDWENPGFPMKNFDALAGFWYVDSRSVRIRMASKPDWQANQMETHYRVLLDGLIAINDTYGTFNGRDMHGFMMRAYDPDLDEWQFHWMSKGYPHLTEQVRGRFSKGIGTFYGTETHGDTDYRMRFRWLMHSRDSAFWEQSYQHPETGLWVPNWTLRLTRKTE